MCGLQIIIAVQGISPVNSLLIEPCLTAQIFGICGTRQGRQRCQGELTAPAQINIAYIR